MKRSNHPKRFLTQDEKAQVERAIAEAERRTSGEVKLVIARHCLGDIKRKAARVFAKRNLHKTELRNAVLILLVTTNREFLVYGDEGIHRRVGQGFWDDVRDTMTVHFKENRIGDGLCAGIERIADKLGCYFPLSADDRDEISDDVGYDD